MSKAPKAQELPTVTNDPVEKMDGSTENSIGVTSQSTQIAAVRIQRIATSDGDQDVHARHLLPDIVKANFLESTDTLMMNFITQRRNGGGVRTNTVTTVSKEHARELRDALNAMDLD